MLRYSTVLTMGVAFTLGMVLGLMIHLPGTLHREVRGGGRHLNVYKRSVDAERFAVVNPNTVDSSESIVRSGDIESDSVFIHHISSDSVERKINNTNNTKHRGKTNGKQPLETSKQIWRIKQAQFATLAADDNVYRVKQSGVTNVVLENSESISGRQDGENLAVQKILNSQSQQNGLSGQQLGEASEEKRKDGRASNPEKSENINTESKMADVSVRLSDMGDVVRGVYWSPVIESRLPNLADRISDEWTEMARNSRIVKMEEGCGRMQNRLVTFQDSSKACARYRVNTDQIQGDFFSFLLSLLLGLDNVPKSVLSQANIKGYQWKTVSPDIIGAQWNDEKLLVLSQFVPELTSVYIPKEFRDKQSSLFPSKNLTTRTFSELHELMQWSDLILFDYLTGNLDRVVNNMFNQQWNKRMMEGPVHNLEKSRGNLVFLDNESGLFHSYRLLDSYQHFHQKLLNSLCIFRRKTVDAIRRLREDKNLGETIQNLLHRREPALAKYLPKIPQRNVKILQERMQHILDHVSLCEAKY